ncbi:MAG: AAA family ATPase [Anaerolineales bacterium]
MRNLIPHFIVEQFAQGAIHGSFSAATMFVDVFGFTQITEALMQYQKDGAEILTDALNRVFGPLVARVYERGGMITTFAGDAFTAVFPLENEAEDASDIALRLAQMAFDIQDFFARHGALTTKYGEFTLGVKVGLGLGEASWGIVGEEGRYTYFFRGPAIDAATGAEHHAGQGDIVASASIWPHLTAVTRAETRDGHHILREIAPPDHVALEAPASAPPAQDRETLTPFVLGAALDMVASGARAEFRQVANVFISFDLPKSPAQAEATLDAFVSQVMSMALAYGGYFNKLDFGDKGAVMLILFGAPVGHENDVERAANFLLTLRELTSDAAFAGLRWRAGLSYGMAYAGILGGEARCEYTAIANVVNFASRLMSRAQWGQILVSEAGTNLPNIDVVHIGDFDYKGFAAPRPTYQLLQRAIHTEGFFEQPLVGRGRELQRLLAAAEPLFTGQCAGVAYIYGEAGIGKSHLAYVLRQELQRHHPIKAFLGQTDQILRQAFNPFTYFFKRYFDQSPEASSDENKARFTARLDRLIARLRSLSGDEVTGSQAPHALAEELDRTRSVLGALLGLYWPDSLYESLDGNLRYQNILMAIKSLLLAESCFQPILLKIEDLQWLDEASSEVLTVLFRTLPPAPIFVVVTSRYQDDGGKPTLTLPETTPVISVDLNALAVADLRQLAEALLGGPVSDDWVELLAQRTQANPFFAQQFLYYFRENDLLTRTSQGAWTMKAQIPADMPTTINAILIARIDRLAQEVKDVVKAAAILGREFDDRVLAQMLASDVSSEVKVAEQEQIWSPVS